MPVLYLSLLFSAFAFVICVFSFFYFRSYLRRRTGQERILSELREEVDKILRSIDETTDRDISLIEEQEKKLKSLLEEIEKRLKVYVRELEKRRDAEDVSAQAAVGRRLQRNEGTYQELGKNRYRLNGQGGAQPAESAPAAAAPVNPATPASPAETGLWEGAGTSAATSPGFPLPSFRVKPSGQPEAAETAETTAVAPPPVGERVRELVRAGFAPPVIASRLGLSIAEVEFAVALLERRDA